MMTTPIRWIALAAILVTLAIASAQPKAGNGTPKNVLNAYARAMETQNYKAMAGLILGGQTDFDYSQLVEHSPDFDNPCRKVRIKVGEIEYSGDTAVAAYGADFYYGRKGDPMHYDGKVKLVLDQGSWKIRSKQGPIGSVGYIEYYAHNFAHPEETLKHALKYFEPTRNRTLPTIKLGMARAKFLEKIFALPDRSESFPPYNGYSTSTFDQTTTIYWPVGRSDELIFAISFAGPAYGYLTKWKLIDGRAKRVWQVNVYKSKDRKLAKRGTLAKEMKIERLPSKASQDVIHTLGDPRPYAAYIPEHFGDYFCWTVLTDGSTRPVLNKTDDPYLTLSRQNNAQAFRRGFFITPWEVMLMEKLIRSKQ